MLTDAQWTLLELLIEVCLPHAATDPSRSSALAPMIPVAWFAVG
jgi:hypothetical protein